MIVAPDCAVEDAQTTQEPSAEGSCGNWHLRLATLLVTLRSCLNVPDRDFFDRVHASAHRREIPTQQFFSYALDILRQHKPELEDQFREVFRLRNASRRRAHQQRGSTLRSSRSESSLADERQHRVGRMSQSCEDVASQARSAEEVDETMYRLQALCVHACAAREDSVLTKRHSETNMYEDYELKRKAGICPSGLVRAMSSIAILCSSP